MMSRRNPRGRPPGPGGRREGGASSIELMVAGLMIVLIVIPIFSMMADAHRIFARGEAASALQQDLRGLLDRMVRELRMAGYDPSATGSPAAFEAAAADTVRFIADVDGDGVTDRVEYAHDAAARTVTRRAWLWAGAAWAANPTALVVARDVESMRFAYFDATDAVPATLADIRRVTVEAAGSDQVGGHGTQRYRTASEARARNLL